MLKLPTNRTLAVEIFTASRYSDASPVGGAPVIQAFRESGCPLCNQQSTAAECSSSVIFKKLLHTHGHTVADLLPITERTCSADGR